MRPPYDFWDDALCAQIGTDLFFPDGPGEAWMAHRAKSICGLCPVRQRCLEWALSQPMSHDQHGVFGGLAPRERNRLRRRRAEGMAA